MNDPKEPGIPAFHPIAVGLALPTLFFIFRITAAILLLVVALGYLSFWLHRSHRSVQLAFGLFFAAIIIPVDVYVPGFHGPLVGEKKDGMRFVQVLYGMGARPKENEEAIQAGCVVGLHDVRWRLVWD